MKPWIQIASRWTASLVAALGLTLSAPAQTAPAGNEHPDQRLPVDQAPNPLAPATSTEPVTREQKWAFARQVDLSPLSKVAVMTGSRVGILDTVARELVRSVTGRHNYQDFLLTPGSDGEVEVEKVGYEPMFTFIDLMADPAYYSNKPLLHVELLDLREELLERVFPDDAQERERWMMLTRVSPGMLAHQAGWLQSLFADSHYTEALGKLLQAVHAVNFAHQRLLLIAPDESGGTWRHVSEDPQVAGLFAQLGEAWRALDAERVNAIAAEIARTMPVVNQGHYPPSWRIDLEVIYNGSGKFMLGYTLYFAAALALLIAMGTGRPAIRWAGITFLLAALAIHAAGFVIRWILAERIPIQNQFESMMGICLGATLFGTIAMFVRRQPIFGVAAAAVGFLTLMTATLSGIPGQEIQREAAILNTSYILFYHVNIVLFSYALIALGAVVSTVYLVAHYFGGEESLRLAAAGVGELPASSGSESAGEGTAQPGRQRLLHDLDHAQMVILQLAFWILGVGILLGAWWADHSWGRWWAFDPKETWALITWIVYLIIVHVRFTATNRGLVTAWLSLLGFFVMLWTYFGVNLLLPGLHAYA